MMRWPDASGFMTELIAKFDWSGTALGTIDSWPDRLRLMVEHMLAYPGISTLVVGPDRILLYNDAAARLYGDKHPAALGRPLFKTWPTEYPTAAPFYRRAFNGEAVVIDAQPLDVTMTGGKVFDTTLLPVRDAAGQVIAVQMTGTEVGARLKTEAALLASEQKYRALFATSPVPLFVMSADPPDFRFLDVNDAYLAATMTSRDDLIGHKVFDVFTDDPMRPDANGPAVFRASLARVLETRRSDTLPRTRYDVPGPDGRFTERWWLAVSAPMLDTSGQIASIIHQVTDVTHLQRAEAAEKETAERFRALVTAGSYMTYRMNADWSEMLELRGQAILSDTEAPDQNWPASYILPDDQPMIAAAVAEAIRTKSQFELEHRVVQADGSTGWVQSRAVPIFGQNGEIREWFGAGSDITGRKMAEMAAKASEARQAFLLTLSDALRPLADADEVKKAAARLLGEHLAVNRAYYGEVVGDDWVVIGEFEQGISALPQGNYPASTYGDWIMQTYRDGKVLKFSNALTDARFSAAERAAHVALSIIAAVGVGLIKQGHLVAILAINSAAARDWTVEEISLIQEVAERTWDAVERARAEAALRVAEESHRSIFSGTSAGFLVLAPDSPRFTITDVNDAYLNTTMTRREDLIGRALFEVFPENPDDPDATNVRDLRASLDRVLATKRRDALPRLRYDIRKPGGGFEQRWWDPIQTPLLGIDGTVTAIIHHATEQTGVERAEATLRESEERQAFLLRLSDAVRPLTDPVAVQKTAMAILGQHLGIERAFYAEVDEATGTYQINDCYAKDGVTKIVGRHLIETIGEELEALRQGRTVKTENVAESADLSEILKDKIAAIGVQAYVGASLVKAGRWIALVSLHSAVPRVWTPVDLSIVHETVERTWDAVERASSEAARRKGEQKYRTLFDSIDQGFSLVEMIFDEAGNAVDCLFLETNVAYQRQTGLADPSGKSIRQIAGGFDNHMAEVLGTIARTGESKRFVTFSATVNRWYDVFAFRTGDPDKTQVGILFQDVTERKKSEQALRDSEVSLRELNETLEHRVADALAERRIIDQVIDGSEIFVQVVDRHFNWMAINKAGADEFATIFRVPRPHAGDNMLEALKHRPIDRAAVQSVWARALAGEEFVEVDSFGDPLPSKRFYEMRFRALRDADGTLIGAYQFVTDVSVRLQEQARLRDAEEILRQSQKMEAMGQLTGGVAHDFNNLLTAIMSNLEMLGRLTAGDAKATRLIEGALQGAQRGATLTQRMLAFARRQELTVGRHNIATLVRNATELLQRSVGDQIDLVLDIARQVPMALVDDNQFDLALLNLVINARDAMPEGGQITVRVDHRHDPATSHPPGGYVCLTVEDQGQGMDAATLEKAIQPFFTTKGVGKGSGLGLSMIHGLAAQLNGQLVLKSEVGKGTVAELWLPATIKESAPPDSPDVQPAPPSAERALRILFVDDDALISMSSVDLLEDLGHEVTAAPSGAKALDILHADRGFDLLITDYSMPKMTGGELAAQVRALYPDLPILLATGYAELPDGNNLRLPRLAKPYLLSDLKLGIETAIKK